MAETSKHPRVFRNTCLVFVDVRDLRAFNARIAVLFSEKKIPARVSFTVKLKDGRGEEKFAWAKVPMTDAITDVFDQLADEFPRCEFHAHGATVETRMKSSNVTKKEEPIDPKEEREKKNLNEQRDSQNEERESKDSLLGRLPGLRRSR